MICVVKSTTDGLSCHRLTRKPGGVTVPLVRLMSPVRSSWAPHTLGNCSPARDGGS